MMTETSTRSSLVALVATTVSLLLLCAAPAAAQLASLKIICVGDSHTEDSTWRQTLSNQLTSDNILSQFLGQRTDFTCFTCRHEGYYGIPIGGFLQTNPNGYGRQYQHGLPQFKSPIWNDFTPSSIAQHQPEIVTLFLGTNDVLLHKVGSGTTVGSFQQYRAILNRIYNDSPTTTVICVTLPPLVGTYGDLAGTINEYNNEIKGVVQSYQSSGKNIFFVDLYANLNAFAHMKSDGVHMNSVGDSVLASLLFDKIKEIIVVDAAPPVDPPQQTPAFPTFVDATQALDAIHINVQDYFANDGRSMHFNLQAPFPPGTGFVFDQTTNRLTGAPTQADVDAGAMSVTVTATDTEAGGQADGTFTLRVENRNDAPTVKSPSLLFDLFMTEGDQLQRVHPVFANLRTAFDDVDAGDADRLTIVMSNSLPSGSGLTYDQASASLTGTFTLLDVFAGAYSLKFTATDPSGASAPPVEIAINIIASSTIPHAPTTVPSAPYLLFAQEDTQLEIDASQYFTDIDQNERLTYSIAWSPATPERAVRLAVGSQTGTVVDPFIRGLVTKDDANDAASNGGQLMLIITVTDRTKLTAVATVVVNVSGVNSPPVQTRQIRAIVATQGVPLTVQDQTPIIDSFEDNDAGDVLSIRVDGLPEESTLYFDSVVNAILGTATNDDVLASPYGLIATVTDREGESVVGLFSLNVINANDPPNVVTAELASLPVLRVPMGGAMPALSVTRFFADVDPPPQVNTMYEVSGLPDGTGLRMDSATGRLYGQPTLADQSAFPEVEVADASTVEVAVIDEGGLRASFDQKLMVTSSSDHPTPLAKIKQLNAQRLSILFANKPRGAANFTRFASEVVADIGKKLDKPLDEFLLEGARDVAPTATLNSPDMFMLDIVMLPGNVSGSAYDEDAAGLSARDAYLSIITFLLPQAQSVRKGARSPYDSTFLLGPWTTRVVEWVPNIVPVYVCSGGARQEVKFSTDCGDDDFWTTTMIVVIALSVAAFIFIVAAGGVFYMYGHKDGRTPEQRGMDELALMKQGADNVIQRQQDHKQRQEVEAVKALNALPPGARQIEEANRALLEEQARLHKGDLSAAARMSDAVAMLNVAIEVEEEGKQMEGADYDNSTKVADVQFADATKAKPDIADVLAHPMKLSRGQRKKQQQQAREQQDQQQRQQQLQQQFGGEASPQKKPKKVASPVSQHNYDVPPALPKLPPVAVASPKESHADWACTVCTYVNTAVSVGCDMCGHKRKH